MKYALSDAEIESMAMQNEVETFGARRKFSTTYTFRLFILCRFWLGLKMHIEGPAEYCGADNST